MGTFQAVRWSAARFAAAAGLALCFTLGMVPAARGQGSSSESAQEAQIDSLIKQLAADDFASRERAQAELSKLGLEAFDALHAAQSHHDPEIALRARYLVRSMSVRWFTESDSPQVVSILKGYGDVPEADRRSRIDKLAALENDAGLVPLVRLSRFETHEPVAKYAALKLLTSGPPEGEAETSSLIRAIEEVVGGSKRTSAAAWLRLYARTLTEPDQTLAEWDRLTRGEHDTRNKNPHLTSDEIVRDLYRFQVDLLDKAGRNDEAGEVIRRTFELLKADEGQIAETIDWLQARGAYSAVLELMEDARFRQLVQGNALLLYRLAETQRELAQSDKAAEIAERALALNPDNHPEHLRIGYILEQRGLHDWAEREYRHVLQAAAEASSNDFKARFHLSELLHDQARELPAAETLKPVCDLMEKDEATKEACERARRRPETVIARMHYFFACHYRDQQDHKKEREHLEQAIAASDEDADVLIAMHRLAGADEAWQARTRERIETATTRLQHEIETLEMNLAQAGSDLDRTQLEDYVANLCNEYAWIVGNTIGDYDDAVKRSHRSLELKPGREAYLDTLGRAYYAKGDLASAVKYQVQAVQASHSGQIRRQLDFFLKEAEKAGVEIPEKLLAPVRRK